MYTGGDFPWIVSTDNMEDKVYGVLLTFEDPDMIEEMDMIELGAGYTRVRESIVVDQSEGEFGLEDEGFEAWVYIVEANGGALIESGRWE